MIKGLIVGVADAKDLVGRLSEKLKITVVDENEVSTANENRSCPKIEQVPVLDTESLKRILDQWKLLPKDCLCIVGTRQALLAANSLGIPCVAYQPAGSPEKDFSGVDWVLEGFDEVDFRLLDDIHTRKLGLPVVIAETSRLLIREMTLEDLDDLYKLYEEPGIRRFVKGLSGDRAKEEERTKAYIRYMYGMYQFGMWTLIEKESGRLIGRAGFGIADYRGKSELDLGYLIGTAWQRQGLATEACRAVLDYGREVLGFSRVAAYIQKENAASIKVAQKLGFQEKEEIVTKEKEHLLFFEKDLETTK